MIRESPDAARHIVRGLLTFGRQMPLERRHVMLDELIEKVLALTAADLRIESVKVDRDSEPPEQPYSDRHRSPLRTGPRYRRAPSVSARSGRAWRSAPSRST